MGNKLLVAIPAYNEEDSIGLFIDKLKKCDMWGQFDLIVINDGSLDRTEAVCRKAGVVTVTHIFNLGYGAALKTAYKYAVKNDYDYVIQIDGDGQHDAANIRTLYNALTTTVPTPDIIIGSRFVKGSTTFQISKAKKIVMGMFTIFVKLSTGKRITDPTSGLQGLTRKAFEFYAKYNNFAMDYPDSNMIMQMLLLGYDIQEIPAIMHRREAGESMHSGLKPLMYTIKMLISSTVVILRDKAGNGKYN